MAAVAPCCLELRTLALQWCRAVSETGLMALLSRSPNLESATLGWVKATDNCCGALASGARLAHVDLRTCREVSDAGLSALARRATALVSVALVDIGVTDAGVAELFQHAGARLRALHLSDLDKVTSASLRLAAAASAAAPVKLVQLHLSHLKSVDDDAVAAVIAVAPSLARVELHWLSNVGEKAVGALRDGGARRSLAFASLDGLAKLSTELLCGLARECVSMHTLECFNCGLGEDAAVAVRAAAVGVGADAAVRARADLRVVMLP